jgi:hypothetical protein
MQNKFSLAFLITLLCFPAKQATSFEIASSEILMKEATSEWWSSPERSMTFLDAGDVNNDGYDDLLIGFNSFPDREKGWVHDSKNIKWTLLSEKMYPNKFGRDGQ